MAVMDMAVGTDMVYTILFMGRLVRQSQIEAGRGAAGINSNQPAETVYHWAARLATPMSGSVSIPNEVQVRVQDDLPEYVTDRIVCI